MDEIGDLDHYLESLNMAIAGLIKRTLRDIYPRMSKSAFDAHADTLVETYCGHAKNDLYDHIQDVAKHATAFKRYYESLVEAPETMLGMMGRVMAMRESDSDLLKLYMLDTASLVEATARQEELANRFNFLAMALGKKYLFERDLSAFDTYDANNMKELLVTQADEITRLGDAIALKQKKINLLTAKNPSPVDEDRLKELEIKAEGYYDGMLYERSRVRKLLKRIERDEEDSKLMSDYCHTLVQSNTALKNEIAHLKNSFSTVSSLVKEQAYIISLDDDIDE